MLSPLYLFMTYTASHNSHLLLICSWSTRHLLSTSDLHCMLSLLLICSWSAHDLLMICSWSAHDLLMICSWSAHDLLMICSWMIYSSLCLISLPDLFMHCIVHILSPVDLHHKSVQCTAGMNENHGPIMPGNKAVTRPYSRGANRCLTGGIYI